MRILTIDIETRPALVYTWKLFKPIIGINQIVDPGGILGVGYKFLGDKKASWVGADQHDEESMLAVVHSLLDEADAVVHYNGAKFDVPWLEGEFTALGWTPPAPYVQVDLIQTIQRRTKFLSSKLDYAAQRLGIGQKLEHAGFSLWMGCMNGDAKAWRKMAEYCKQDVELTETLYAQLRPWIRGHPNVTLIDEAPDELLCPRCGSDNLTRQGYRLTMVGKYQRYRCSDCGGWSSEGKRVFSTELRNIA